MPKLFSKFTGGQIRITLIYVDLCFIQYRYQQLHSDSEENKKHCEALLHNAKHFHNSSIMKEMHTISAESCKNVVRF